MSLHTCNATFTPSQLVASLAFLLLDKIDGFKREFSVSDTSCVAPRCFPSQTDYANCTTLLGCATRKSSLQQLHTPMRWANLYRRFTVHERVPVRARYPLFCLARTHGRILITGLPPLRHCVPSAASLAMAYQPRYDPHMVGRTQQCTWP